jgi:hypothetical protein
MPNKNSRYNVEGRLPDVIAAVTVLAAAKESEGNVSMWTDRLSRPKKGEAATDFEHWSRVFSEHPEFFLTYVWEDQPKAALRLRYANKTVDRATGQPHPNYRNLPPKERGDLTSLPLEATETGTLINTAISLHQATLARRADDRFLFQIFRPALLALIGALMGAFVPTLVHGPPPPMKIVLEDTRSIGAADAHHGAGLVK